MSLASRCLAAFTLCLISAACLAHKQSDSYLTLELERSSVRGRWDIALRDLDMAIGVDANADGEITWGEVRTRRQAIERYAFGRLNLEAESGASQGSCPTRPDRLLIDEHVDGAYAVLIFTSTCPVAPQRLGVDYHLMYPLDPNHQGLLQLRSDGATQTALLSQDATQAWLRIGQRNGWQEFRAYVQEGIWHIWQGYDHLLFLFTLLLPSVVVYRQGEWRARTSLRDSATDILKVVSAFTLSHSITLSLAALGVVNLPSRLVESAIALTVLLGALNILFPLVRERRWLVALAFGLVHGLGFASVLGDLGLPVANLLQGLLGFNVGVEIGQLAVVALLMPAMYLIRETLFYRRLLLPAGASLICVLAGYWIVIRAFPTWTL